MAALYKTLRFVSFALIVALVVSVAMGVFCRYVLQRSLYWATEVPNFLFVWIVFLGAVVAYHEKKHIAFTALVDVVPPRTRAAVEIMGLLLVLQPVRSCWLRDGWWYGRRWGAPPKR